MAGMEREWKNGVFGCFSNMGNCCYAYFCPCCAVGKVAERVGDSCCMCCLLSWCVSPLISICIVRGKVRSAYGIQGSGGGDCVCSCCCPLCTLCQMLNETEQPPAAMAKDDSVITAQPGQHTSENRPDVVMQQPKY